MSSKLLYIDNVTTDKYIKNYSSKHKSNDKFTYITFTEYERAVGDISHKHGDIFFNGEKITYYNDVDSSYVVTDGLDNFVAYVNDKGCIAVGRAGVVITDSNNISTNRYELFNIDDIPDGITYNFVSNIDNYVNVSEGTWKLYKDGSPYANNGSLRADEGKIKEGTDIAGKTREIHIAYEFNIEDTPCVSYAYVSVNNINKISKLTIQNFPKNLAYGTIFTPFIKTTPTDAIQNKLTWSLDNGGGQGRIDNPPITIFNSQTGTFRCEYPCENVTIKCSYENGETSYTFNILKVNPHLSVSAYETTYLWGDSTHYYGTTCYAHYDNQGLGNHYFKWKFNNMDPSGPNSQFGNETKCQFDIDFSSIPVNNILFELDPAYFHPYRASINIYAPEHDLNYTTSLAPKWIPQTSNISISITNNPYNLDYNTLDFVVVATPSSSYTYNGQQYPFVDTNYIFDTIGGLDDFTVTDIVYDGTYTFTYVTASIVPNIYNDIYSLINPDDAANYISYSYLTVRTSDKSFAYIRDNIQLVEDVNSMIAHDAIEIDIAP